MGACDGKRSVGQFCNPLAGWGGMDGMSVCGGAWPARTLAVLGLGRLARESGASVWLGAVLFEPARETWTSQVGVRHGQFGLFLMSVVFSYKFVVLPTRWTMRMLASLSVRFAASAPEGSFPVPAGDARTRLRAFPSHSHSLPCSPA